MAHSSVLTLRVDSALRKRLDKLARSTNRSRSFLAAQASREYVALNDWQIEEITKSLEEADRGDFASPADVDKLRKKWARRAR